jgi:hypothetical protein
VPAGGFGAVVPVGCATPIAKGIVAALTADTEQSATRNDARRFAVKADFMMQIRGSYMKYHNQTAASRIQGPPPPSL